MNERGTRMNCCERHKAMMTQVLRDLGMEHRFSKDPAEFLQRMQTPSNPDPRGLLFRMLETFAFAACRNNQIHPGTVLCFICHFNPESRRWIDEAAAALPAAYVKLDKQAQDERDLSARLEADQRSLGRVGLH